MSTETKANRSKTKQILTVIAALLLVILLSAGTSILVNCRRAAQTATTVKNGLSAYGLPSPTALTAPYKRGWIP